MSNLFKMIVEKKTQKSGMIIGLLLAVMNILMVVALQTEKIKAPATLNISILLVVAGLLLLKMRPRI